MTGWAMAKRSASDFDQSIIYETDGLFIVNRAMAEEAAEATLMRSRLDDLKKAIKSMTIIHHGCITMQTRKKRSVMLRPSSMRNICFAL